MAFSDMLFSNTHSVEQLVDIKKKKQVDKVLLKVIRTIRSIGSIKGWIKPEADMVKDLKMSVKAVQSVLKSLGSYYSLDLSKSTLRTAQAITNYIKTNKGTARDSIFFVDVDEKEADINDEVQLDDDMEDPSSPLQEPPAEETPAPPSPSQEPETPVVPPQPTEPLPDKVVGKPEPAPTMGDDTAANTLEPAPDEQGEPDTTEPDEQTPEPGATISTEGLTVKPKKVLTWADMLSI